MRREGGKLGSCATRIASTFPAISSRSGHAVAELDAKKRPGREHAGAARGPSFRDLTLPAGTWELLLDTNATPAGVAFRCDGSDGGGDRGAGVVARARRASDASTSRRRRAERGPRDPQCHVRPFESAGGISLRSSSGRADRRRFHSSLGERRRKAIGPGSATSSFRRREFRVELPQLSHARAIELSVDGNDRYGVLFARGSQVEGSRPSERARRGDFRSERSRFPEAARTEASIASRSSRSRATATTRSGTPCSLP